jgi:alpha-beta hydrolase superfamily lysophospholipase
MSARSSRDAPRLSSAALVMHALHDAVVPLDEATRIFHTARHPKSFVAFPEADHLLGRLSDGDYVADVIVAWARGYPT